MDRLRIIQVLVLIISVAILTRLFYWQFFSSVEKRSSSQFSEDEIPAPRGDILASDGFPLATNQEAYLVYASPKTLKDNPKNVALKLAPNFISERFATVSSEFSGELKDEKEKEIKSKEEEMFSKLSNKKLVWVLLGRKITAETKEKIADDNIAGIGFERDDKRFYPEASMAAQVLGFVGSDKFGKDIGYFGLEGYYDNILAGRPGKRNALFDPQGVPILTGKFNTIVPKKGSSVQTTIDRTMQFLAETKIRLAVLKYGAKEGMVIIADPKTGGILAMANYPSYNPGMYQLYNEKFYKNPMIADSYEPGSTFKIVTMSSALDQKVVSPETKCDVCGGPLKISGYEISTWNKKYYPQSTMTEVIAHSDNIGMTFVSQKLGLDNFINHIAKFGFGKKTGIDLQEETAGFIRNKKDWREIDLATASFGQGIAVTPIQIVQAACAIANKGKMNSPRLVTKTVEGGKVENTKNESAVQVISPEAAAQITEMMVNAVDNGEARAFKPQGYRIAGKTGTAQIPVAGHYDPDKTIASFVGFAPADDPKFVMLVRFTEPTSSIFGSETAAPTFFDISRDLFNYLAISPSK